MAFNTESAKAARKKAKKRGPNKETITARQAVVKTWEVLQQSKDGNMTEWAKKNLTEFYKIYSKLISTEIDLKAQIDNTVNLNIKEIGS